MKEIHIMLGNLLKNIKFLFMPNYWIITEEYDPDWDEKLLKLMEENNFTGYRREYNLLGETFKMSISDYQAKIGDEVVWVKNHPYGSFLSTDPTYLTHISGRPSRQTIYLAGKKLKRDMKLPGWSCEKTSRRNDFFKKLGI